MAAGQTTMEMERLHLGEPTKILGLTPTNALFAGSLPLTRSYSSQTLPLLKLKTMLATAVS